MVHINKFIFTLACLLAVFSDVHAQHNDMLDCVLQRHDVSLGNNSNYVLDQSPDQRACDDKACERYKKIPFIRMSMQSSDGQCKVYVVMSSLFMNWVKHPSESEKIDIPNIMTLMDLKILLGWGGRGVFKVINKRWQEAELLSMMTKYPKKKARSLFNADFMYSIPINFFGETCQGKFTNGRCVMAGKHESNIVLYFFMTDSSAKNFDRYLDDVKGILTYNW